MRGEAGSPAAFLFDANRCTGCQACELACSIENELDGFSWRQVVTLNEARHPDVPVIHLSMACNHCAEPPCLDACPALAYARDPVTGLVGLDAERCIGCRYCSWACPYDAPRFDAGAGVMTKCTFCAHRQAEGQEPACVEQCPTGALGFGVLADLPGVDEAPGLPTTAPGPSIRFVPWRGPAVCAGRAGSDLPPLEKGGPRGDSPRKIALRQEWPLAAFTLIAALLVASFAAALAGAPALPPLAFFLLAAAGMGLSTLHLGKPLRAWRAVLGVRRSWLAREIALFSLFLALSAACFLAPEARWLGVSAAVAGFAALFAMDRVYDLARPPEARPVHSADVLLTGALAVAILTAHVAPAAALAALKLVLYLRRKLLRFRRGLDPRWRWSAVRLAAGLAAPLAAVVEAGWPVAALAAAAVGELIDRCELYEELEVPTPRARMAIDSRRHLGYNPPL